jgi:hypothetical protein
MSKIRKGARLTGKRDYDLLMFIWEWKVVGTDTLHQKFFTNATYQTCYNRLRKLELAKYLDQVFVKEGNRKAWIITRKGFGVIKEFLVELRETGFKSESPCHDYVASRFQLGDFARSKPQCVEFVTEQMLRRYEPCLLPSWLNVGMNRRPDGYTAILKTPRRILTAIEFERTPKDKYAYSDIASQYRYSNYIDYVLWLVPTRSLAARIDQLMAEHDSSQQRKHQFVLLDDFLQSGWGASVIQGSHSGKSVRQFFASQMPSTELSKKQEAPPYVPSHPQDNPRENPMKMPVLCSEGS